MTDLRIEARLPGVAWLILDRPARHNAFDEQMIADLTSGIERLDNDDTIHTIVLAATGPSFSAGADLDWMKRAAGAGREANLADARALAGLMRKLDGTAKTTIAVVQGAAMGGGVGLIACCDVVIGSAKAVFALSEVKLGLIPAAISPFVIAAIGARAARRYFQTAETFNATEALRIGLLHEVVAAEQLDERIETLLTALAQTAPLARKSAKQLVREVAGEPLTDRLTEFAASRIADIRAGDEAREGLNAFLSRRPATWISAGDKP